MTKIISYAIILLIGYVPIAVYDLVYYVDTKAYPPLAYYIAAATCTLWLAFMGMLVIDDAISSLRYYMAVKKIRRYPTEWSEVPVSVRIQMLTK